MSDSGLAQGENSGSSLYATLGMGTAGAYTGSANLSLARHNGGMTDLSLVNKTLISLW
ncbi:MAG TPA: hypothetical protein VFG29_06450 [Syntrophales bacterium]|nr:hypothetical protein [Syntrophales bacterium]